MSKGTLLRPDTEDQLHYGRPDHEARHDAVPEEEIRPVTGADKLAEGNIPFILVKVFIASLRLRPLSAESYSTVTLLARLRGLSTLRPRALATW